MHEIKYASGHLHLFTVQDHVKISQPCSLYFVNEELSLGQEKTLNLALEKGPFLL